MGTLEPRPAVVVPAQHRRGRRQQLEILWTERLLRPYPQGWQRGVALHCQGAPLEAPRGIIKPWAPYRQLVGFDRQDGLWVGDGSSIKHTNWSESREEEIAAREAGLARHMGGPSLAQPRRLQGLRPYWAGAGPCLLARVQPGLWVASGGAKNGTLSAGWAAWRLARELT